MMSFFTLWKLFFIVKEGFSERRKIIPYILKKAGKIKNTCIL